MLTMFCPDECADECRRRSPIVASKSLDDICIDSADVGATLWCPICDVGGQFIETTCVFVDVVKVNEAVTNDDVHHRQHQCDVSAGQWLDELIGRVCGDGAHGVDDDDFCPLLTCFFDEWPEMAVRQFRVRAPQQDQFRIPHIHGVTCER